MQQIPSEQEHLISQRNRFFKLFLFLFQIFLAAYLFYLISLGFFTVGSLLCCLSKTFSELLAGRSIQEVGGGGILVVRHVILTDIIPLRERPIYIEILQISWAIGSISGPLIGGLFVHHTTWRCIFYINFVFCGIGDLTIPLVMKLDLRRALVKKRLS